MFVQGWQILKQSHDNIFVSHEYLQASRFTSVLTSLIWFSMLSHSLILYVKNLQRMKKYWTNSLFHGCCNGYSIPLLVFDNPWMYKLILCQVECNDGHCFFDTHLVLFFSLWDQCWKVKFSRIYPQCPKDPWKPIPSPMWISKYWNSLHQTCQGLLHPPSPSSDVMLCSKIILIL